jgi:hypothetical protein
MAKSNRNMESMMYNEGGKACGLVSPGFPVAGIPAPRIAATLGQPGSQASSLCEELLSQAAKDAFDAVHEMLGEDDDVIQASPANAPAPREVPVFFFGGGDIGILKE